MSVFRFKLEPVRRQRERAEQDRQREVAQLESTRQALLAEIAAHERGIAGERFEWQSGLRAQRPDLSSVRAQAAASLGGIAGLQRAAVKLAGVEARLRTAREALVRAAAARKAIDRLRDRQREAFERELGRREAAAVDELVTVRFGRSEGGL